MFGVKIKSECELGVFVMATLADSMSTAKTIIQRYLWAWGEPHWELMSIGEIDLSTATPEMVKNHDDVKRMLTASSTMGALGLSNEFDWKLSS